MRDRTAHAPSPSSPPTALGYATVNTDRGHGVERCILALREIAGERAPFVWGAASEIHPLAPLVKSVTAADAVRAFRATYAADWLALRVYPVRTSAERAAAIDAGVLTELTGTLEPAEIVASRLALRLCVNCRADSREQNAVDAPHGNPDVCAMCYASLTKPEA